MERFYKMWRQQLHHHLHLYDSPSQSVATFSPPRHSQPALKSTSEPASWSVEAVLPWLTLLFMAAWLAYQSWAQAQGYRAGGLASVVDWSKTNHSMPSVVPITLPL